MTDQADSLRLAVSGTDSKEPDTPQPPQYAHAIVFAGVLPIASGIADLSRNLAGSMKWLQSKSAGFALDFTGWSADDSGTPNDGFAGP